VFLVHATWNALCDIARERDCTVDDLCLNIGNEFPDADFTQAAQYYVCANSPRQSPDRDEARRGIAGRSMLWSP
jgi:predicted DNA-binding ribbon-helix-helix protein